MKELVQQKQAINQRIFIYGLISATHYGILPMIGGLMIGLSLGQNIYGSVGCVTLLYALIAGHCFVNPYCDKRKSECIREQFQLEDHIEHIKAVNQSLDERRNMMLFDKDTRYWKILEQLAGVL